MLTLDYAPAGQRTTFRQEFWAYIPSIAALVCFCVPITINYVAERWICPGNLERAGFMMVPYMLVLWPLSAVLGIVGAIGSATLLRRSNHVFWLIASLLAAMTPPCVIAWAIICK